MQGAAHVARELVRHDGIRGLYKGFGTVIVGVLPARVVILMILLVGSCTLAKHMASRRLIIYLHDF